MSDLISRADAIEHLRNVKASYPHADISLPIDLAIKAIEMLPSAETHDIRTETHGVCLISKDDAMGAVQDHFNADGFKGYDDGQKMMDRIKALPSADATVGDYPNDLISRNALMEYCSNQKSKTIDNNDIARFPSADAVQGEWKAHRVSLDFICSNCGEACWSDFDYCPHCGARMKGGEDE